MQATATPLAELINRGRLASPQPRAVEEPDAPASTSNSWLAPGTYEASRPDVRTSTAREIDRIWNSVDLMIQSIKSAKQNGQDPEQLRKSILKSIESFLVDVSSTRW